jgi:amino acid adenylation domain-containing protein
VAPWAAVSIDGPLDMRQMREALSCVLERHEALRTSLERLPGMELPLQVINPPGVIEIRETDLSHYLDVEQEQRLNEVIDEWAAEASELHDRALAVSVVRLRKEKHVLLLGLSPLCGDLRSLKNVIAELGELYASQLRVRSEDPVQYVQFSEWQRELQTEEGEADERGREYWRDYCANLPETITLAGEQVETAVPEHSTGSVSVVLDHDFLAALRHMTENHSAPLDAVLLAAWQVLLFRVSGDKQLFVLHGTPARKYEELQTAVGQYTTWLPLHSEWRAQQKFSDMLSRLQAALERHAKYQEYYQPELLAHETSTHESIGYSHEEWPGIYHAGKLIFRALRLCGSSQPLKLHLQTWQDGVAVRLDFRYGLRWYSAEIVQRLAQQYQSLLHEVAAMPEKRLRDLSLLGAEEQALVLRFGEGPTTPQSGCENLNEEFERQVERTPEALAVKFEGEWLSYRKLNQRANQLARYLRAHGCEAESRVGLMFERRVEMIVAVLAVLKAGGVYMPLDPDNPGPRLASMLADATPLLVLTQSRLRKRVAGQTRVICLDEMWEEISRHKVEDLGIHVDALQLAYVLYTSGSTGRPKGVAVSHGSVLNLLQALRREIYAALGPMLRVAMNAPLTFDASVKQLFQLLHGHALLPLPDDLRLSGRELVEWCSRESIDVLDVTPAHLRLFLDGGLLEATQAPKAVLVGGEAIDEELWERLQQESETAFYNVYGPTECTVDTTVTPVAAGTHVSLGRALDNVSVCLLDERNKLVGIGERGELCIAGAGLARGYFNDAAATAERFVPHPYARAAGEQIYKSGDVARWLADGTLEYVGRNDWEVKVRGFRIQPGEIEAALLKHAGVRECLVSAHGDAGEKQLVAYVVPQQHAAGANGSLPLELSARELRRHLEGLLPEQLIPSAFVQLEALPLTRSAKVDRRALEQYLVRTDGEEQTTIDFESPLEEMLAAVWSELLKRKRIASDDNFFELGGHSLLATQLISRVRDVFGVEVGLRRLFEEPTLRGFSQSIDVQLRAGVGMTVPRLVRAERAQWNGLLPLSFAQQRLWFLDQLEPGNAFYNSFKGLRLRGKLDLQALERTLTEIVRRHELLRTRFVSIDGEPRQEVLPAEAVKLAVTDLSGLAESEREAALRAAAAAASKEPFDLGHGPLLRVKLLRLSEHEQVVLLTMHHIVSDGWSMGVLIREVATLYEAYSHGNESPLPELPVQYGDFAVWQRSWLQGDELERQMSYWRRQLGGELPGLELPADRRRPAVPTHSGAQSTFRLAPEVSAGLKELSRRERVTLFMTMLAAFQTLLYRYTDQQDIVVGTDVANRNRAETEPLIGFFVNQLVLRTNLSGAPTFVELLRRVKEVCLGAYAHQDVPFEKLVEELQPERDLSRSPLFQVKLVLQNTPRESLQLGGLQAGGGVGGAGVTARFDITLFLEERGGELGGAFVYSTELFEAAPMERMVRHFEMLLQGIVANPEQRLWELPLLREAEIEQTVRGWNETHSDFNSPNGPARVHELFEAQVERDPGALALICDDRQLTYGDLNTRANQLARYLRKQGVGPEVVVGLCLNRTPAMVVALLGVLKAGGAYLPLDPDYPTQRLEYLLADAQVGLVLTKVKLVEQLPVHWGRTIVLDEEWDAITAESTENLPRLSAAENLAYVIYTSGSTGKPKGVMITQGGLANYLQWASCAYEFAAGGCSPVQSTLAFDLTVTTLYAPLLVGGWLELWRLCRTKALEAAWQERSGYDVVKLTPAHLRLLNAGEVSSERVRRWSRALVVGGEALLWEQVRPWVAAGVRVYNEYGPTETVVGSSVYEVEESDGSGGVSIGRPIGNTEMHVLDQWQQPVPVGVRGEIYIGGAGVARGYWQRAELTAEKFVPHAFSTAGGERLYRTGDEGRYLEDGRIEYLGRRDEQVKVRGYRLEPGEIEAVLESHAGVRQAVVTVREESAGDQRLVGYVVGESWSSERDMAVDLRGYLKERLPDHMVPQQWVLLEQLPLTANGKVDRKSLPAPSSSAALDQEEESEWTPVEELLAGIWSEVLKVAAVGREENFFELGGHSLVAVQLVAKIRDEFSVELPIRAVFEAGSVRGLAERIERARLESQRLMLPPIEQAPRDADLPVSFQQERRLRRHVEERNKSGFYASANSCINLLIQGNLKVEILQQALNEVIRRHETLRTCFVRTNDHRWLQRIAPKLEVEIPVTDLRNLPKAARKSEAFRLTLNENQRRFDPTQLPLLRAHVIRLSQSEQIVVFAVEHMVFDGESSAILINEVMTLYDAFLNNMASPLPDLPLQYPDFSVWQRRLFEGPVFAAYMNFWKQCLDVKNPFPYVNLPFAKSVSGVPTHRGEGQSVTLSPELVRALKTLSHDKRVTLFMIFLAVLKLLLHSYTGKDSIGVLAPAANRRRNEVRGLIGWFANVMVFQTSLSNNPRFSEVLARVKESSIGAFEHQDIPFDRILKALDYEMGRDAPPTVFFAYTKASAVSKFNKNLVPYLQIKPIAVRHGLATTALTLRVNESIDKILVEIYYEAERFATEDIQRMLDDFHLLLQSIITDAERPISELLKRADLVSMA